jgi:hypothetical protein
MSTKQFKNTYMEHVTYELQYQTNNEWELLSDRKGMIT